MQVCSYFIMCMYICVSILYDRLGVNQNFLLNTSSYLASIHGVSNVANAIVQVFFMYFHVLDWRSCTAL